MKKKNFEKTRKLKIIEPSHKKNINVNDSFIVLIDKKLALATMFVLNETCKE